MKTDTERLYLGIDVGSISVNTVLLDGQMNVLEDHYDRTKGQPIQTVIRILKDLLDRVPADKMEYVAVTGSGGKLIADLLGGSFVNEVIAQSKAVERLHPHVRTVIEMGGEDSKLLFLDKNKKIEQLKLKDFAMNTMCAAGTGSFLDQQASRLGLSIEEFGRLALKSQDPPRIAGRCSVFAKTDMIHLQQIGTPDYDIVAGLCYALARSFKSNVGRGKEFTRPIAFQGGVAANSGVVKAFEDILKLQKEELIIPEHFASMGAIGSIYSSLESNNPGKREFRGLGPIEDFLKSKKMGTMPGLSTLTLDYEVENEKLVSKTSSFKKDDGRKLGVYVGVDVGSLSTNVVALDENKKMVARRYLRTAGRPIEAVRRGLREIGEEMGDHVEVFGASTTGSGRYLTGQFIGADIVKNEITAQATAAIHFDRNVDTIFEIGGQDSKFISIDNGAVVDFEMNKVCAAGTGSFLEEQAEKLGINIVEEFGDMALGAESPGKFGDRCTVFMESDLVTHQQKGAKKENLVAGLAYSIVHNYLNKVVGEKRVGNNIFFQGGVAWNKGVVAAFERVTGKKITVPPHHDVTGAIGAAILAINANNGKKSNFKGFDLTDRKYETSSFTCKACENICEIRKIKFGDEKPVYYGTRCERYEIGDKKKLGADLPDLFDERDRMLLGPYYHAKEMAKGGYDKKRIGIPKVLHFYELFPYWRKFFEELDFEVLLSEVTNPELIHKSMENIVVETCFPMKIVHGHVLSLIEKGVDYIFLPSIINTQKTNAKYEQNYFCPLVQAAPYIVKSAFPLEKEGVKLLTVPIFFMRGEKHVKKSLRALGKELDRSAGEIKRAITRAQDDQEEFQRKTRERGKEVIEGLKEDQKAVVIVSRPYNGCDSGINLDLPKKLKDMGVLAIPLDYLSYAYEAVDTYDEFPNMFWSYGQRMLAAADVISKDDRLNAIYITNFKCGPDSFILHFFWEKMNPKPHLQIEVDEHSADAGAITRCEAFLDSLENVKKIKVQKEKIVPYLGDWLNRAVYVPHMCDHAYALSAAFRSIGILSEVLEESDDETLELGRRHTSGKECFPFIVTTGDFLKKLKEPGIDPAKIAFFMPSADGPCRFGQYNLMQRLILKELGYKDIPIVALDSKNSYSGLGRKFRRKAWQGIVAVDILEKLARETRPYEVNKGEADSLYRQCLNILVETLEGGNGSIPKTMEKIKSMFQEIKVDRNHRKPIIGVVGEIFIRSNRFSNDNIVLKLEGLGGEAWVAPFSEWLLYVNNSCIEDFIAMREYKSLLKVYLEDIVQRHDEHHLSEPFKGLLLHYKEAQIHEVLENSAPYMHSSFGGEAILSIGKSIDYIKKGVCGIVNAMPFTCMPGMVVTAISKKLREDFDDIPWINMVYDGQEESNFQTRLEAFMHQVKEY
ncbi:MAG: acyl-CoA dehydratase activase, partial [Desulfatiglandales bacterium]